MSEKPTILIIIHHYVPGYRAGGTVRSVLNLVALLGDEFNFRILTYNHDKGESQPYLGIEGVKWYPVGKAQVRYLTPQETGLITLRKIIQDIPHDILQLESVLAITSLQVLVLCRLRLLRNDCILLVPRGHLGEGALRQKATKKAIFLKVVKLLGLYSGLHWYATSKGEKEEIIKYFGEQESTRIHVHPDVSEQTIQALNGDRPLKRTGELRVVFLSRISPKKNLAYAMETLRTLEGNIEFDIYGPIEDENYWAECQKIIEHVPTNIRIRYCGIAPFEQVVSVLGQYHLFYLPTLHENYGHVIFEALSAGCPVLISDQTPWKGLERSRAGWVIPLDNQLNFTHVLSLATAADQPIWDEYSWQAKLYAAEYIKTSSTFKELKTLFEILCTP